MASSRRSAGCIGTVRYQLTCVMLKTRYSSRRAGPRSIVTAKLALCAPGTRERARAGRGNTCATSPGPAVTGQNTLDEAVLTACRHRMNEILHLQETMHCKHAPGSMQHPRMRHIDPCMRPRAADSPTVGPARLLHRPSLPPPSARQLTTERPLTRRAAASARATACLR